MTARLAAGWASALPRCRRPAGRLALGKPPDELLAGRLVEQELAAPRGIHGTGWPHRVRSGFNGALGVELPGVEAPEIERTSCVGTGPQRVRAAEEGRRTLVAEVRRVPRIARGTDVATAASGARVADRAQRADITWTPA